MSENPDPSIDLIPLDRFVEIASDLSGRTINPDLPLIAQGVDSLAAFEILATVEDLSGARLPEEIMLPTTASLGDYYRSYVQMAIRRQV